MIENEQLNLYIDEHISPEPEHLAELYRDTWVRRLYPRMCTDHYQGRLLTMLTRMIRPLRILELGTYTGYSTLCFAEGMPDGATIDTIEVDDEMEEDLKEIFHKNHVNDRINLHIGDAEEIIPTLCGSWDLAFIDANKRRYPQYFNLIFPRIVTGGYILADNTLWSGRVTEVDTKDPQLTAIRQFNDIIRDDPRIEKIIITIRDGLTLIRKISS